MPTSIHVDVKARVVRGGGNYQTEINAGRRRLARDRLRVPPVVVGLGIWRASDIEYVYLVHAD